LGVCLNKTYLGLGEKKKTLGNLYPPCLQERKQKKETRPKGGDEGVSTSRTYQRWGFKRKMKFAFQGWYERRGKYFTKNYTRKRGKVG